jgi:hypothetical protein
MNEDNLQYYHNTDEKYTICCEVPSKEEIMLTLGMCITFDNPLIPIKIGAAKCHPDDRYVRKIGRKISSENLETLWFLLDKITFVNEDYYCVKLFHQTGREKTKIMLEVKKDTKKVYFVDFTCYNI